MLSYSFSLTEEQVFDFFKKFRAKNIKLLSTMGIIMFVLSAVFFVADYFFGESYIFLALAVFMLVFAVFVIGISLAIKKALKPQSLIYFNSCQANGVIDTEFQLYETEFVVLNPVIGNVTHYKYDIISNVMDLDGFVAVVLKSNLCLPIVKNETTAPLISTLKSLSPVAKR